MRALRWMSGAMGLSIGLGCGGKSAGTSGDTGVPDASVVEGDAAAAPDDGAVDVDGQAMASGDDAGTWSVCPGSDPPPTGYHLCHLDTDCTAGEHCIDHPPSCIDFA